MAAPRMEPMFQYYLKLAKHPVGSWNAQCAIRLSMTLHNAGVYDSTSYQAAGYRTDRGWALRAEELYQWLRSKSSLGTPQLITCSSLADVPRSHGIVYLRNCWRRSERERTPSGDHIDLLVWVPSGPTLMTNYRWGNGAAGGCDNELMYCCADGKIRFWPCTA